MRETYYGFYSPAHAHQSGYAIYQTADGTGVVHVTAVYTDPQGSAYWWHDKQCVGPVGDMISPVSEPRKSWPW